MPITVIVSGNIISHCFICITEDNGPVFTCICRKTMLIWLRGRRLRAREQWGQYSLWTPPTAGWLLSDLRDSHWEIIKHQTNSLTRCQLNPPADTPRIETELSGNVTDIAPLSYPLVLKQFWNVSDLMKSVDNLMMWHIQYVVIYVRQTP